MRQNTFLRNTKPIQLTINEMCFYRGLDSLQGTIGGQIVNMILTASIMKIKKSDGKFP